MLAVRAVAATILRQCRQGEGFAPELIERHLGQAEAGYPADRRLLVQLVHGTIRRQAALDACLQACVERPWHAVELAVRELLRLGAYQLLLLTHIPPHAAVHETVEAAGQLQLQRAKGFINGVLRRLAGLLTDEFATEPTASHLPVDTPLPPDALAAGSPPFRYRRLQRAVFPDPQSDPAGYLATAFSYPRRLVRRWLERHELAECYGRAFWFNAPPPLWLRVNRLRTDRETYRLRLLTAGIESHPGPHPQALYLPDPPPVRELPGYAEGDFCVQDLSAMQAATALEVRPGMKVLDLCAAPGGKTTLLAEQMHNRGQIIACDVDARRLDVLRQLCQRLGVTIVEPVLLAEGKEPPPGPFDAALVDVPCSNTGVLGRRPEARWRFRPEQLPQLVRRQTELLLTAAQRVRPGGVLVYATCSIEPEENEQLIQQVRRTFPGLKLEAEEHARPGRPADGGYWARLRVGSRSAG